MGIYIATGICLLVGSLFFFFAIKKFIETVVFIRAAAKTVGRVIRLATARNSDGHTLYLPVFQYQTNDGKLLQYTSTVASKPPAFEVGETVQLFYLRKNPQNARVDSFSELWLVNLVLVLIGLSLLGIAPVIFFAAG